MTRYNILSTAKRSKSTRPWGELFRRAGANALELTVSEIPISYIAAGSSEEQLEQIITQKWIVLCPDSEEACAELRRTGYPILYNRLNSLNVKISVYQLPRRMPFVSSEYSTNESGEQCGQQPVVRSRRRYHQTLMG